jgi:hypothetical protein
MGISDLAIIRCVFHINAAKKKISIHNFDFGFGKIIDAVASLNPPVAGRRQPCHTSENLHLHFSIPEISHIKADLLHKAKAYPRARYDC